MGTHEKWGGKCIGYKILLRISIVNVHFCLCAGEPNLIIKKFLHKNEQTCERLGKAVEVNWSEFVEINNVMCTLGSCWYMLCWSDLGHAFKALYLLYIITYYPDFKTKTV